MFVQTINLPSKPQLILWYSRENMSDTDARSAAIVVSGFLMEKKKAERQAENVDEELVVEEEHS